MKSTTPRALVRPRSICSGRSVAKTRSSLRARVTATLRRRCPPSLLSEEICAVTAAALVGADRHRKDDHVALVALNVLDVLDEDRLAGLAAVEMRLERRIASSRLVEHVLDQPLLVAVERDDADRFASMS